MSIDALRAASPSEQVLDLVNPSLTRLCQPDTTLATLAAPFPVRDVAELRAWIGEVRRIADPRLSELYVLWRAAQRRIAGLKDRAGALRR